MGGAVDTGVLRWPDAPKPGEPVFVELKNVKVFPDDYSI